ncbi:MAG: hypothetical protein GX359_06255 [Clostridiales bacterium]|nr:hypothetical protein [Clostridiales bacterium]
MKISVKDKSGIVYSTMPMMGRVNSITAIHFCTSYIQFEVQSPVEEEGKWVHKDIVVLQSDPLWVDLIDIQDCEIGEIVECELINKESKMNVFAL